MFLIHNIIHPESFLGLTDLKTGSFVIAAIDFIMTVITVFGINIYGTSVSTFIALICTGLGVYGISKNKKSYVLVYEIYLIINVLFSCVVFVISFISFSLQFIIESLILFIISIYACRVVNAHYKQMDDDGITNKVTETANKFVDAVDATTAKV